MEKIPEYLANLNNEFENTKKLRVKVNCRMAFWIYTERKFSLLGPQLRMQYKIYESSEGLEKILEKSKKFEENLKINLREIFPEK